MSKKQHSVYIDDIVWASWLRRAEACNLHLSVWLECVMHNAIKQKLDASYLRYDPDAPLSPAQKSDAFIRQNTPPVSYSEPAAAPRQPASQLESADFSRLVSEAAAEATRSGQSVFFKTPLTDGSGRVIYGVTPQHQGIYDGAPQ